MSKVEKIISQIIKLRDEGKTLRQISDETGISKANIALFIMKYKKEKTFANKTTRCICTHSFLVRGCNCGYRGD